MRPSRRFFALSALAIGLTIWLPTSLRPANAGVAIRVASSPPVALGPDRGWIDAMAMAPNFANQGNAWVAPAGGEIFATSNSGTSWTPARNGITDPVVTGLAVSPNFANDGTLFAAADNGVFISHDAGHNWQLHLGALNGHYCRQVAASATYQIDQMLLVSTDAGVYRSTDGGATWLAPQDQTVPTVSLAMAGPSAVFSGPSRGGLLESSDAGATWFPVNGFPAARTALSIAPSPNFANDGTIFVATDAGLLVSRDSGFSWALASLPTSRISSVVVSPAYASDHTVFAGSASGAGVFASRDAGQTWSSAAALPARYIESLAASPMYSTDHTVLAGTAGSGVERSTDGGKTWFLVNSGLHAAQSNSLVADNGSLYIGGSGGASVLPAPGLPWQDYQLPTTFVTSLGGSEPDLFVGTQDQGLLASYDSGTHWAASTFPYGTVNSLGLSPYFSTDRTLFVAGNYVYRSQDAGSTWTSSGLAGDDVRRLVFSPAYDADHNIFAATVSHGVYVSTNGGDSWRSDSQGLPSSEIDDVLLSPRFAIDRTAYAATAGYGIWLTTDGGATWTKDNLQPPDSVVTALAWSPNGQLVAGTERHLYLLSGSNWSDMAGGWTDYITRVVVLTAGGTHSYFIGTLGDGVWRLDFTIPATATPTPTPTRTPSPVAVSPKPSPTSGKTKSLHPKVSVFPRPPISGQPALLVVRGPGLGRVWATLTSSEWRRSFAGTLNANGWGGFGFITPATTMKVTVKVQGRKLTGSRTITVHVSHGAESLRARP